VQRRRLPGYVVSSWIFRKTLMWFFRVIRLVHRKFYVKCTFENVPGVLIILQHSTAAPRPGSSWAVFLLLPRAPGHGTGARRPAPSRLHLENRGRTPWFSMRLHLFGASWICSANGGRAFCLPSYLALGGHQAPGRASCRGPDSANMARLSALARPNVTSPPSLPSKPSG
jgi:hypothetical protein